jgi:ABC-type siderophore export system fused ATPase/permease subunit
MATMVTLLNIVFFISFADKPLLPTYTVFAIGFYMRLCNTIGFNFTRALTYLTGFKVSCKRLENFLLLKELPAILDKSEQNSKEDKSVAICMKDFSFAWKKETGFSLDDINLTVNFGKLSFVVIIKL